MRNEHRYSVHPADNDRGYQLRSHAVADAGNAAHYAVPRTDRPTRAAMSWCWPMFTGMSHGELAGKLRVPLGTVKSWVRRSLVRVAGVHGMNQPDADDVDATAADYVMGLLDDAEHGCGRAADRRPTERLCPGRQRLAGTARRLSIPPPRKHRPVPALWQRIADATKERRRSMPCPPRAPRCAGPRCGTTSSSGASPGDRRRSSPQLLFATIMVGALTTSRHLRQRPDCAGAKQAGLRRRAGE